MLLQQWKTRDGRREKRAGRKSWGRASRVGAFENVISIIARWFYEAVQARNAWRLGASLYASPLLFFSPSTNPLVSTSAFPSVHLFLGCVPLPFVPTALLVTEKRLSLSVHFNLLKARIATPVVRRDMWASNVTSWTRVFQITQKTMQTRNNNTSWSSLFR